MSKPRHVAIHRQQQQIRQDRLQVSVHVAHVRGKGDRNAHPSESVALRLRLLYQERCAVPADYAAGGDNFLLK